MLTVSSYRQQSSLWGACEKSHARHECCERGDVPTYIITYIFRLHYAVQYIKTPETPTSFLRRYYLASYV